MKILLIGNYRGDRQRSMERFSEMLLHALRAEGIEAVMLRPAVIVGGFFRKLPSLNKWLGYFDKFLLFPFALRRAVKAHPSRPVHIVDQGNGIYAGWLARNVGLLGRPTHRTRMPSIVTCHDLLAIRAARGEFPGLRIGWTGKIFQSLILRGLRHAGTLVCISGATSRDAQRLIGASTIIPNGVEDFWQPVDGGEGDYLLHVGGGHWYKNRPGVVRIFLDLRRTTSHAPRLLMVGPPLHPSLTAELKEAGLERDVTIIETASDEELRALYSGARALLFPSLEEGAGWPILEAQACGCPVITRRKEPMIETGGGAALYADDGEWVQAIAHLLEMDAAGRAAIVAAGRENARRYSVTGMAREYIALYRTLLQ
jgi:glycosyltransferase involved in cell wall biosynthesis